MNAFEQSHFVPIAHSVALKTGVSSIFPYPRPSHHFFPPFSLSFADPPPCMVAQCLQWVHVRNDTTNCSTVTPAQRLHRLLQSSQSSSQAVAVAPLLPPSSSLKSNDLNGKGNADDQLAVSGAAQHQSTEAAKNDGGQGQWGVEVEEGAIILAYAGAASEPVLTCIVV